MNVDRVAANLRANKLVPVCDKRDRQKKRFIETLEAQGTAG